MGSICRQESIGAIITAEINEIDNMWHTFILFTKDYASFCQTYFDGFIHHDPTTDDTIFSIDEIKDKLRRQLIITQENFGSETLIAWYKDKKYALAPKVELEVA